MNYQTTGPRLTALVGRGLLASDEQQARDLARIIRARRRRGKYFPAHLFSDPAWDILLSVALADLEQQRISMGELCDAADAPRTTALRYLQVMIDEGVVVRVDDPLDRRRKFISLSPNAAVQMARAPAAPACGSYLELRRGQHVIVVRVVWSDGLQFGAQAQSRLVPSDVIEGGSPPASPAGQTAGAMTERRLLPRVQEQSHEQSRWRARGLEYMGIAAFAAVLAFLAYDASQQALARSLAAVDSSLAASNSR